MKAKPQGAYFPSSDCQSVTMRKYFVGLGCVVTLLLAGCTSDGREGKLGRDEAAGSQLVDISETHPDAENFLPNEFLGALEECDIMQWSDDALTPEDTSMGFCELDGDAVGVPQEVSIFVWSTGPPMDRAHRTYAASDVFRFQEADGTYPTVQIVAGDSSYHANSWDADLVALEIYYPEHHYQLGRQLSVESPPGVADPGIYGTSIPLWIEAVSLANAYGFVSPESMQG